MQARICKEAEPLIREKSTFANGKKNRFCNLSEPSLNFYLVLVNPKCSRHVQFLDTAFASFLQKSRENSTLPL